MPSVSKVQKSASTFTNSVCNFTKSACLLEFLKLTERHTALSDSTAINVLRWSLKIFCLKIGNYFTVPRNKHEQKR